MGAKLDPQVLPTLSGPELRMAISISGRGRGSLHPRLGCVGMDPFRPFHPFPTNLLKRWTPSLTQDLFRPQPLRTFNAALHAANSLLVLCLCRIQGLTPCTLKSVLRSLGSRVFLGREPRRKLKNHHLPSLSIYPFQGCCSAAWACKNGRR